MEAKTCGTASLTTRENMSGLLAPIPIPKKLLLGLVDFSLLNFAFAVVHSVRYKSLSFSPVHMKLLLTLWVLWGAILLLSRKLSIVQRTSRRDSLKIILKTDLVLIMAVSFAITSMGMLEASRTQAYVPCLLFLGGEVAGCLVLHRRLIVGSYAEPLKRQPKLGGMSPSLLALGAFLPLISFAITLYAAPSTSFFASESIDIILIIYGLWSASVMLTHKYDPSNFRQLNLILAASTKSIVLLAGGAAMLVYGARYASVVPLKLIFGPIGVYSILELIVFYLYFLYLEHGGNIEDIESIEEVNNIITSDASLVEDVNQDAVATPVADPVEPKLMAALEFLNPNLFSFIQRNINLHSIDRSDAVLLSTDDLFNVTNLEPGNAKLFINLCKLNNIRWFNQYFLTVHSKLVKDGYFVGKAHTIETQKSYYLEKYPFYISFFVFALQFIWKRVMPKLPLTKKFYFACTQGRNRTISMTEVFGRLYYCGFKVVAEEIVDNRLYFVAQKVNAPSQDTNPTYGLIIRLKRFGYQNMPITVYKFRTMHPYSEYLQQYVYEKKNLTKGGKFKDDFRVTSWGKFLRKTWLDELPMLYNWLQGDLKLLGVRPLSKQYLSLYNEKVRELRELVKPGLIPPFYADLPSTFDEIQASEQRYIESYLKRPRRTQLWYLYKSLYNIICGARSA